jgi:predicted nucleotidyltransferase
MRSTEVIARLKEREAELRARGVRSLALFGSTARNEARPDSDIDLLIELDDSRSFSLIDLSELKFLASDLLGRGVDIAVRSRLRSGYRDSIQSDAITVF